MKKIELLAPAGSMESLVAAVQNGANAVYLSGKNFGARKFAANFSYAEIGEAVTYCRIRHVKVYVTVNTLIKDEEFEQAIEHVRDLVDLEIDALIIQDIGLLTIVRQEFPEIEIHASTQMSIHNLQDMKFAEKNGVDRVVIAREVSIEEISYIAKNTDVELEAFVHGALCISYSGQCLMSSMQGSRSGNRGCCAQPCRQMYDLVEYDQESIVKSTEGQFLLSPRELNTIKRVPELIESGVVSFKIEGRMKRPEYVAVVVKAYREAIDSSLNNRAFNAEEHISKMERMFNRKFTEGHMFGERNDAFMSLESGTNRGLQVGEVIKFNKSKETMTIKINENLNKGDELQIRRGNESVGCRADIILVNNQRVKFADKNQIVDVNMKYPVNRGEIIFRTVDEGLLKETAKTYEKENIRIKVDFDIVIEEGQNIHLTCKDEDDNVVYAQSDVMPEKPEHKAVSVERIIEQLSKLGGTPYLASDVKVQMNGDFAFSMKVLNLLRRDCIDQLDRIRSTKFKGHNKALNVHIGEKKYHEDNKFELRASVFNKAQLEAVVASGITSIYIKNMSLLKACEAYEHIQIIPVLDRVNSSYDKEIYAVSDYKTILVSNLGQMAYYIENTDVDVITNYSFNVLNYNSAESLFNNSVSRVTLSYELTLNEIRALRRKTNGLVEVIVYGKIPMMIFDYCPVSAVLKTPLDCGLCEEKDYCLSNDRDQKFALIRRSNCNMEMYSDQVLYIDDRIKKLRSCGIDSLRLEFTTETSDEVTEIIKLHQEILNYEETSIKRPKNATTGHFIKGVD